MKRRDSHSAIISFSMKDYPRESDRREANFCIIPILTKHSDETRGEMTGNIQQQQQQRNSPQAYLVWLQRFGEHTGQFTTRIDDENR